MQTEALVKLFGNTPALIRVTFSLEPGRICGLVGGNGAGKTTLLRLLATALRPSGGRAVVYGHDVVRGASAVRALVGLMPATGGPHPELTPAEHLRFALTMRARSIDEVELARTLEAAGLATVRDEPVRSLSTGMVRRVGLAAVMLIRPQLLLLDEPYAGLDEEGRALIDAVLVAARADGRTALVSTHERSRMAAIADVSYQLERGLLVDVAPARPTPSLASRA